VGSTGSLALVQVYDCYHLWAGYLETGISCEPYAHSTSIIIIYYRNHTLSATKVTKT